MNLPTLENRVMVLETVNGQINERLNSIDNRMNSMENRFDNRLNGLDNRLNNMDNRLDAIDNRINSNFKWLVGLLVTVLLANMWHSYYHYFDGEQNLTSDYQTLLTKTNHEHFSFFSSKLGCVTSCSRAFWRGGFSRGTSG